MPWPKGQPFTTEMVAKRIASLKANGKRNKRQNADGTWPCATCGRDLPAAAFYKAKRAPNGLKSQCRECHLEGAVQPLLPMFGEDS